MHETEMFNLWSLEFTNKIALFFGDDMAAGGIFQSVHLFIEILVAEHPERNRNQHDDK